MDTVTPQVVIGISEAGWVQIITLVLGAVTTLGAAWLAIKQQQMQQQVKVVGEKADETKIKVEETKTRVDETQVKVDENLNRLDGRLTMLLDVTRKEGKAEGKAEAETEAKLAALELLALTKLEAERLAKDRALIDALTAAKTEPPLLTLKGASQQVKLDVEGTLTQAEEPEAPSPPEDNKKKP